MIEILEYAREHTSGLERKIFYLTDKCDLMGVDMEKNKHENSHMMYLCTSLFV